ncbi:MAG: molecular chaperone, partial [Mycobacterium sp.]|nr:molecular chaperone [Mycobacterium sp.]
MSEPQGMSEPLGLSVGTTNLVAARVGATPVTRRSVLTVFTDRAPEVGEFPGPNQPGLVLAGFVDRVGDPVPLVAADGSSHRGEVVLVEALDVMANTVGGGAPVTIAVPAHWGPRAVGALRNALRAKPSLSPNGIPAALIPDSVAALAGLRAAPGLPSDGVVLLCDFGGGGTSITLADARADLAVIGDTVRYQDFSGDLVDQALLNHVVAGIAEANSADPASTAAVGSLARLRDECRAAKERLSAETAAVIQAELPGYSSDVRITRSELERLIEAPLGGLLSTIAETLQRYRIPLGSISAVATVGGGAAIPLVTQRLSEQLRAPVVTTPLPVLGIAAGAAVVAASGFDDADQTGMAPTGMAPTSMAPIGDAPTGLAPTMGWAAGAPFAGPPPGDGSSTSGALAWSQDDAPTGEPVPYAGGDYQSEYSSTGARPEMAFAHEEEDNFPDSEPLAWYKRPPILFGAAAAAALLAVGGLAVTLTGNSTDSGTVTEIVTISSTGANGLVTTSLSTKTAPPSSQSGDPTVTSTVSDTPTSGSTTEPTSTTTTTSPTTTTTT